MRITLKYSVKYHWHVHTLFLIHLKNKIITKKCFLFKTYRRFPCAACVNCKHIHIFYHFTFIYLQFIAYINKILPLLFRNRSIISLCILKSTASRSFTPPSTLPAKKMTQHRLGLGGLDPLFPRRPRPPLLFSSISCLLHHDLQN